VKVIRPREDQARFSPWVDEDGARSLASGSVPRYVQLQARMFLRGLKSPAAMVREMRRSVRVRRRQEARREDSGQG
jgi:hypothetical protein